ncbi:MULTISPECIES: DNA polymerase III subunit beta [Prochlorococcus]|uniref:DNA polymerase III subunit beta n=1 Tax=Prochlorococcus TaxID=1218 RepID=UPI0005339287|nr:MULTISPECIES: DNA polymerase III subunit beta [Prochlorococcus]KGG13757.1 DNA polymerasee III beta subunit [Prochlorococcus sp. MIT 0601]
MKLVCSQSELNGALQLVSRAVASRPTHPVLANVLLTADAGTERLSLTGFDLNFGIQTSIPASVEISGATTLPAKLFGEIISKLSSDSPVNLSSDESGEQVQLESKSGSYQMRGLKADDFPDLPLVQTGTSFSVKPYIFANALKSTLFASSSDESKQILTGVHLTFIGSSLKAAATDGHRLVVLNLDDAIDLNLENNIENTEEIQVTLPSKSLREIERFIGSLKPDDKINLFYDSGQVVFISLDQVVTTRTLEGVYPNYSQLIPPSFSNILEFDRKTFLCALDRIAVLADQHNNVIKITKDTSSDVVKITTDAQDVGSGMESVPVKFNGENFQIAFNVRYLLEGLKVFEVDKILLRCNSPTTPAVFSPVNNQDSFIYLVMPVQIRS